MPIKRYNGSDWEVVAGAGVQGPQGATGASATTVVTTKGDLLSYSTTAARLAVGNNGETLVADSSTSTGLRYQADFAAGKNKVLNSDFGIWQRGTSIAVSSSSSPFVSDRWRMATNASQDSTVSRQLVSDTTNLPEIQYCLRYQRNSGQTGVNPVYLMQYNETIACVPLAGKTVTFSFYARKGANFSSTSNVLSMGFQTGTGTDQNLWNAGYTNQVTSGSLNATLTSTMQRFSVTFTIPANTTEFGYWFYYSPTGTAGAADYFDITGVQLEAGSVATAFQTATGTIQGELAACQRYYWRQTGTTYSVGFAKDTFFAYTVMPHPVRMRVNPTLETTGTASNYLILHNATSFCSSVPSLTQANPDCSMITYTVAGGTLTTGQANLCSQSGASTFIGFSAEL
jgi:hypothetical protein